jgi:transglutaminase-like putative cysteine protease
MFILSLPVGSWLYLDYQFTLIQDRAQPIKVVKKYFRDNQGEKIPEAVSVIKQGDRFSFIEKSYLYVAQEDRYNPYIEIATDMTWEGITTYLYSFYKTPLSDEDVIKSPVYTLLGLRGGADALEDDIQTIIEYVQNQIVYLYDAEVMHGYLPQASEKTLEMKSGDCKAKSLLLVNLLKTLGVDAEFILINYDYDYFIPESLPSPFTFNHAIVKIHHQGKEYFVDPTWSARYGILEKRSEPFFSYYLPIKEGASLINRGSSVSDTMNIDEMTKIDLVGNAGTVKIDSTYRRDSADIVRGNFNKLDSAQNIKNRSQTLLDALSYSTAREIEKVITDATYSIVSDDRKNNVLVTS